MTKNDDEAKGVSQSGPYYDGQDVDAGQTGQYSGSEAEANRGKGKKLSNAERTTVNPFASLK